MDENLKGALRTIFTAFKVLFFLYFMGGFFYYSIQELLAPDAQMDIFSIFTILILIALLEIIVRNFFPAFYFKFGIPILRRNLPLYPLVNAPTNLLFLPQQLNSKGLMPQIDIRQLNDYECGLWASKVGLINGFFKSRSSKYNPLTRGYILLDRYGKVLKLRGYLNWFTIPFFIGWFGIIYYASIFVSTLFVIIGTILFLFLFIGEREQYLALWDGIERYATGEYDLKRIEAVFSKDS